MLRETYGRAVQAKDPIHARMSAYNVGCVDVRRGDRKEGLDWLRKSIENGFRDIPAILQDPDLASLHGNPEFDPARRRNEAGSRRAITGSDEPMTPLASPPRGEIRCARLVPPTTSAAPLDLSEEPRQPKFRSPEVLYPS